MALLEGHPVYFVVFDPEPVEGQTMGSVVEALARFIEIVAKRHPGSAPIVYGNCQGGWAVVLALSHCKRETGLAVLNGSPLSYWAGQVDVNPMRLAGGLLGGVWPAHLAADLGNGQFDGAWLVQNFEGLRPEGIWSKYDQLYAQPDRERERFLEFERWWNGFYKLGREEILTIVRDLFIGNLVEQGEVVVDNCCRADLSRIRTPLVIFCSLGDNITPPAMRTSRLVWSERLVPAAAAFSVMSRALQSLGFSDEQRDQNPWYQAERDAAHSVAAAIESWRHLRDRCAEWAFQSLYGWSPAGRLAPPVEDRNVAPAAEFLRRGVAEGVVRNVMPPAPHGAGPTQRRST